MYFAAITDHMYADRLTNRKKFSPLFFRLRFSIQHSNDQSNTEQNIETRTRTLYREILVEDVRILNYFIS